MGIGYTIDTPLKVSHLGIDSVISLVDDILIEKFRELYCQLNNIPYLEITDKEDDFRAKRITSYLNLINKLVEKKFEDLKNVGVEIGNELKTYFNMLPDSSVLKQEFKNRTAKLFNRNELRNWLNHNLSMGSIDVNIMTKVDRENFKNGEKLPVEFNDGHAALRGYANSDLNSSIILSAGMNPRLYGYLEHFEDFFPDKNGFIKKKIVLKVSDYRSAIIQGKFLAKKGLWVSEYRVESGLNCGGHAFATDGNLLGPILAEFRDNRNELIQTVYQMLIQALLDKNRAIPTNTLPLKITAQGGVGTSEEHQFLLNHYHVDSVGWGSPFLLVPEVTSVDADTLHLLEEAKEDDLYLSNISPLGIPFNNLKNNTKDIEKTGWIDEGKPGSPCPKKYVALNNEFTEKGICSASRQYQTLKIRELDQQGLSLAKYQSKYEKIVEKSCICVGLGTSALMVNHLDTKIEGHSTSVCPGPNLAYFSKKMSLNEMTNHIYGRENRISRTDRPNMFVKELNIYLDYLKDKIDDLDEPLTKKEKNELLSFSKNLALGIQYYLNLFNHLNGEFNESKSQIISGFEAGDKRLTLLNSAIEQLQVKELLVHAL